MAAPVRRLSADCVEKVGCGLPALDLAGTCSTISSANLEIPSLESMPSTMFRNLLERV
jgi:hypothetical protein